MDLHNYQPIRNQTQPILGLLTIPSASHLTLHSWPREHPAEFWVFSQVPKYMTITVWLGCVCFTEKFQTVHSVHCLIFSLNTTFLRPTINELFIHCYCFIMLCQVAIAWFNLPVPTGVWLGCFQLVLQPSTCPESTCSKGSSGQQLSNQTEESHGEACLKCRSLHPIPRDPESVVLGLNPGIITLTLKVSRHHA